MSLVFLEVGDIVSRISDDRHIVKSIRKDYKISEMGLVVDNFEVECIEADSGGCFKVGDIESNLIKRYEFISKAGG